MFLRKHKVGAISQQLHPLDVISMQDYIVMLSPLKSEGCCNNITASLSTTALDTLPAERRCVPSARLLPPHFQRVTLPEGRSAGISFTILHSGYEQRPTFRPIARRLHRIKPEYSSRYFSAAIVHSNRALIARACIVCHRFWSWV